MVIGILRNFYVNEYYDLYLIKIIMVILSKRWLVYKRFFLVRELFLFLVSYYFYLGGYFKIILNE